MQQLAAAIQKDIDLLVDRYDASLGSMPGYDRLPAALRRDLERHVLNLIAQCMDTGDHTALVQYVQQRAAQWEALGFPLAWFQQALLVPEGLLTPLIRSVEAGNFLWQALNRSQGVVWQMVAQRAHQTEERFRSIVDTSHSGILITDDAFHFTYVNDELVQISGYTREELLGADFRHLLDEESRRIVADHYIRRQRGEDAPPRYEVAFMRKDGTKRYIEMSAVSLTDLNGKPYTVAQVLDVSERKQAEQALRASEAQYQTIFDSTPIMFWLKDTQNRILRVNKAAALFEGVQPSDVEGKSSYDVYPPEQAEAFYQDDLQVIRSGQAKLGIVEQHTSVGTGKLMWVETGKVPVPDEHGTIIGVLAFAVDITTRRQAEETLARERNLLRTLVDTLPEQIFVKDTEGRLILYNQADAKAMGLTSTDEALGKTVYDFYPRELADAYYADDMTVIESEQPLIDREERGLTEDGQERWILTTKVPLKDQAGHRLGLVGIARDITLRKQIESTLQESEERFRRFSEATTEGLVFHDKGVILDANPAIVALFGFPSAAELVGRNLLEFIVPDSRPLVLQKMQLDDVHPYEVDCIRKDGSIFPAETSTRVYQHGDRAIRATAVRDIGARKQAEEALAHSVEKQQQLTRRLRATIDATDELMRVPDLDTLYRRAVELAREKLGVERCGLFIVDPSQQFVLGTYGTDEQGRTTDESTVREPIANHQIMFASQEKTWVLQESPQTHWAEGTQHKDGTGWVGGTTIRSTSGPIAVMYNDAAISQSPVDPDLQETLTVYCSILGNVIERKRLEEQIRESLTRRSIQVQTSVEVAQHVAAAPEIGELFHRVVTLVKERFNYYHAQLFRYVAAEDVVELITGYGEIGQKMLAAGHKLAMGRGVVGTAAATGQSILAADVVRDLDWRPNPNLPDTQGELAVPIKLGSGDPESQLHALRHFASGSYDGIAVAAINPEAIARVTHESVQRGKPVVAITSDLGQDNQTARVFAVEHELGYLLGVQAGTWAKQHLPGSHNVKVGVLTYRPLRNVVERERGIIDGIQSVTGERVTIVASESALEPKEAAYLTEGWLRAYPDLNMIVAYNDATALGAYQAAQNAGWRDPDKFFIGGIDAVPEALDAIQQGGVYQATVNQPPEVMGIMAVRTLIAAIKGLPVKPVNTLYCAPVNRSNAAEFSGLARATAVLANQDIIPADDLSGLDVSGLRLGLSVLTLANPFFAALADSAQKEAQRWGVQLVVNDPSRILGVLDVQSAQANTLTDDDRLLLEGLCGQIASAIESTRLLEQLRQNDAQLSEALKIARLGYWEYDVEKDLFLFNDQFYAIFHTTAEQEGGYQLSSAQYAQKFVHPDDLPIVGAEIERALNSTDRHYSRDLVHRFQYADGGIGYISVNINIDRDEQGHILRYYGANQDITERQQAEEEMQRTQRFLDSIVENIPIMLFVKDARDLRFVRWNKAGEEVAGFPRADLLGKNDLDFFPLEEAEQFMANDRQVLASKQPMDVPEEQLQTRFKGIRTLHTRKIPILDEQGDPQYLLGISEDITERKQAEAERERLLQEQERRAVQLQTASEVSRAASSILNLDELLPQTVELIRTHFELYYVGIFLLDETEQWASLRAGTGEAGHVMLANNHKLEIGGNSMISQCVVTQRARIALDVGEEAVRFENPLLPLTRSEMALPLVSRGRTIGAMTIQSDLPAAFTADDVTALQSMADQIGNAVENARLYAQTQAALGDTDRLLQASAELNISQSYNDVLDVVRKYTALGQQALTVAINVFDRPWTESQAPVWIEVVGYYTKRTSAIDVGTRFPIAMFPSAKNLLRPDAPSIIENFDTSPADPNTYALFVQRFAAKSVIFVPLVVGSQWFGYMNVLYSNPTQFDEGDVRRLSAMVGQAAVAVQNLRNLAAAQQTLVETEASYRATQAIGRAETVEDILEGTIHVVDLIGMTRASLRVVSRRDVNNTVMATDIYACHRIDGQWVLQPVSKDMPVSDIAALKSLQRNPEAVAIYADAQNPNSAMPDEVRQDLLADQLRASILTGVSQQNEVLGFLSFSGPHALNETAEQRLRIAIRTLSEQVAVALQNRLLFEQTRAALQEVDAINRRLTGEAWDTYLRQQAGRDVIWLTDDDAAAPELLPQLDEQLTAGEITLESDPGNRSEATVTAPILLRGQPIGALRLRTPLSEWDEDTEVLLADIAGHIAQAVENARLVEQTQRTAHRERTINEINARVRQSVDLDAILRTAVNELGQSLKAARVMARVGTTATEGSTAAGDGRGKTND